MVTRKGTDMKTKSLLPASQLAECSTVELLEELQSRGGHPGALAEAALLCVRKSQDYNQGAADMDPHKMLKCSIPSRSGSTLWSSKRCVAKTQTLKACVTRRWTSSTMLASLPVLTRRTDHELLKNLA
jgi:hypothetical protein